MSHYNMHVTACDDRYLTHADLELIFIFTSLLHGQGEGKELIKGQ